MRVINCPNCGARLNIENIDIDYDINSIFAESIEECSRGCLKMEEWICFYFVKYHDEGNYMPRHNKGMVFAKNFSEVMEYLEKYFGTTIDEVSLRWAGKKDHDCKQELNFTESEFDRFEQLQKFIEDDKSYEDYCRLEEEYERSKQNR